MTQDLCHPAKPRPPTHLPTYQHLPWAWQLGPYWIAPYQAAIHRYLMYIPGKTYLGRLVG